MKDINLLGIARSKKPGSDYGRVDRVAGVAGLA